MRHVPKSVNERLMVKVLVRDAQERLRANVGSLCLPTGRAWRGSGGRKAREERGSEGLPGGRNTEGRGTDRRTVKKATGSEKEGRNDTAKGSARFA